MTLGALAWALDKIAAEDRADPDYQKPKPVVVESGPVWRRRMQREGSRSPRVIARFWSRVDKSSGPDGCWPWTGPKKKTGYGTFHVRTYVCMSAHRFAFLVANKRINSRLLVRHSCDYPSCVNPAHLLQGTAEDNTRDMVERGRAPMVNRKLSDDQVREIRLLWATGGKTQKDIAAIYKVSRAAIAHLLNGYTYSQVR